MSRFDQKENNKKIAEMLYKQNTDMEIYSDTTGSEGAEMINFLSKINELGYDYHYCADIEFRKVSDVRIMKLLVKYYPKMEFLKTKEIFAKRTDPKKCPEILDLVYNDFMSLSPYSRLDYSDFELTLSRGKKSDAYISKMLQTVNDPDNYCVMPNVRKMLCKFIPEKMKIITDKMSAGILFPLTLDDYYCYNDERSWEIIEKCTSFSGKDVDDLCIVKQYGKEMETANYSLDITLFEYCKKYLCTVDYIRKKSSELLKKRKKCKK